MAQTTKPFWQSSTVLINIAGVLVLIIGYAVDSNLIPDADLVVILTSIANILNRLRAPAKIESLTLK